MLNSNKFVTWKVEWTNMKENVRDTDEITISADLKGVDEIMPAIRLEISNDFEVYSEDILIHGIKMV